MVDHPWCCIAWWSEHPSPRGGTRIRCCAIIYGEASTSWWSVSRVLWSFKRTSDGT
uniref:Uncharacterized protein n=1 Tax=Cucumis melo TaxID=3656 RepID=A0A9I9DKT1_CUCME